MATAPEQSCAATISFDDAQAIIRQNSAPIGFERVPLAKAGRRILAHAAIARIDSPRRDSAAMDGFAVRSQDLGADITRLRLCGESVAGGPVPSPLHAGAAVRISTGAPMPPRADRVVMREHVRVEDGEIIIFSQSAKSHVRARASDFAQGHCLLPSGTRMDARAMVVAAAADLDGVSVWRRPRLHVLSNGDELVSPGEAMADTRFVPDSLSEGLLLLARQWGARPTGASRSGDRVDPLRAAARAALADADIVVVVGGASYGHRDFARSALLPLGLRLHFASVAMKPGKPLWYGIIGKTHILGLPGNPTAAMTTARLFLAPLISALAGAGFDDALQWNKLPALHDVEQGGDRDHFLCGTREGHAARIIDRQEASAQMMLAFADLLVERRAYADPQRAGDMLRCLKF